MDITLTEIERQANRINEQVNNWGRDGSNLILKFDDMIRICQKNDYDIDRILSVYQNSFIDIDMRQLQKFEELANIMLDYVNRTRAAEQTLGDNINTQTQGLGNISSNS